MKPANSKYYPGSRKFWLKMKPDYMRGLEDTGEYCVLGGSWDYTNTYLPIQKSDYPFLLNTFYVGLLQNKAEVVEFKGEPRYRILFSFSAGFSSNDLISFCEQIDYKVKNVQDLQFDVEIAKGVGTIEYFFPNPIIVALKGSSYVKVENEWVLRHACFKQMRTMEMTIPETISYSELQVIIFNHRD